MKFTLSWLVSPRFSYRPLASLGCGILMMLCNSASASANELSTDSFSSIQENCHYNSAQNCEAYDKRALTLDGILYYPNPNVLDIAALYPRGSEIPAHDTAYGWSTELMRSAIIIDLQGMSNFERAELNGLHLRPVSASGTVHNNCVLSAQISDEPIEEGSYAPPAQLDTTCPSPNQITLYLTEVSLTESL